MPQVRLTQNFVRAAACNGAERKIDYFDLLLPGFLLEVRASGGKTYYQRYSDAHGDQRQFRIGNASVLTLAQAKNKAKDLIASIELGSDPQKERAARRAVPTFREFAERTYLPYAKSYKRSWRTDETMIRVHLLPAIGHLHLDQVSHHHVHSLLAGLQDGGYAPGTIARALILLRHMFNVSRKWQVYGGDNPTAGIPAPADVQRNRFLSREEAGRLIMAINKDENRVAAKAVLLLLLTGARRNEITHARWEHIDWTNKTLLVPISKNGKPRWITLIEAAVDLLRSLPREEGNPYVFPAPTTGRPSPQIYFPWDRIRKRAGLADLRLHDLRHSFASFLINGGASLYQVQGLLGHANAKSTQRYSHLSQEALARTAESLAAVLDLQR